MSKREYLNKKLVKSPEELRNRNGYYIQQVNERNHTADVICLIQSLQNPDMTPKGYLEDHLEPLNLKGKSTKNLFMSAWQQISIVNVKINWYI